MGAGGHRYDERGDGRTQAAQMCSTIYIREDRIIKIALQSSIGTIYICTQIEDGHGWETHEIEEYWQVPCWSTDIFWNHT